MKYLASTTDVSPQLAEHLRLTVARLARQIRRHTTDHVLTFTLRSALATIDREGPMTPTELAAHEGVSAPSVTRIVRRLTEEGLIERQADPRDGRGYLVRVSAKGASALRAIRRRGSTFIEARLNRLDRRQLALVPVAIEVLDALLEAAPGEDPEA